MCGLVIVLFMLMGHTLKHVRAYFMFPYEIMYKFKTGRFSLNKRAFVCPAVGTFQHEHLLIYLTSKLSIVNIKINFE